LPVHVLEAPGAVTRAGRVLSYLRARRPDAVNTHNHSAHRASLVARLVRVPTFIMTLHGEASSRAPSWLFRARCMDGVIAVSTRIRERLLAEHPRLEPERVVVVDNGVALPEPSSGDALAEVRLPGHGVIVTVARLDVVKDLGTLLAAVAGLPQTQLILVGDGPERAALEARARQPDLAGRVSFLGFRSDIDALLAASDLFALSSLSEGMSIAALEAMAAGLPVVATAVEGTPDVVVDGQTGLLVPPRDPTALAGALRAVLGDPARRQALGAAGRERVRERFSLEATARRYLDAYRRFARPQRRVI